MKLTLYLSFALFSFCFGLNAPCEKSFALFKQVHKTSWCVLSYVTLFALAANIEGSVDVLGFVIPHEDWKRLVGLLVLDRSKVKKIISLAAFFKKHPITAGCLAAWSIHSGISLKLICSS